MTIWSSREYSRIVRDRDYEHGTDPMMVNMSRAIHWKDECFVRYSTALGVKQAGLQPVQDGVKLEYYRHVPPDDLF